MENKYSLSGFNFENEEQYNKFKTILINNNYLNPRQKEEVYTGLLKNLDISVYTKPEFTYEQMHQIRMGLEKGLDVTPYLNPGIEWKEMERIRLELENNE